MNTPTIEQVREAYKETNATGKKVLESLYGVKALSDIKDRVKTFTDACNELNTTPTRVITAFPSNETGYAKVRTIVDALNEGWAPDWNDSSENKYFPWFVFRGGRFVFCIVDCCCTRSFLGSRLCFRSEELAEYAGRQFEDIYNEFLTIS